MDTRRLTRILRAKGSLSGCIIAGSEVADSDIEKKALGEAKGFEGLQGMDWLKWLPNR